MLQKKLLSYLSLAQRGNSLNSHLEYLMVRYFRTGRSAELSFEFQT